MAGLGLGLGISGGSGGGPGGDSPILGGLYFLTQDSNLLITQRKRGTPLTDAFLVIEPNDDVPSDILPVTTDLVLTQDGRLLTTQDGRIIAQNEEDLPYSWLATEHGRELITQDGKNIVLQNIS